MYGSVGGPSLSQYNFHDCRLKMSFTIVNHSLFSTNMCRWYNNHLLCEDIHLSVIWKGLCFWTYICREEFKCCIVATFYVDNPENYRDIDGLPALPYQACWNIPWLSFNFNFSSFQNLYFSQFLAEVSLFSKLNFTIFSNTEFGFYTIVKILFYIIFIKVLILLI